MAGEIFPAGLSLATGLPISRSKGKQPRIGGWDFR